MNRTPRTNGDHHPSADLLLLNLEGELDPQEAASIDAHLKHCWSCRARSERMQRSICAFVEHRDAHVLFNLPSSPSEVDVFRARLSRLATDPKILSSICLSVSAFFRLHAGSIRNTWEDHRPRLLSAVVATAMAMVLVTLPVVDPPAIIAAVILERARASRESALRRSPLTGIYQRVEIRHGGRAITRDLYKGLPQPARFQAETATDFQDLFRKAGFNWDDPLNVQSFADWRDALMEKDDTVRTNDKQITLTTRAAHGSPIAEASLTVRQDDWHPVAESIQLRGVNGPVEIAELAFEIRESTTAAAEAPRPMAFRQRRTLEPGEDDLQIAEAELREALHKVGADVREAPEIWRNGDQILFYVLADQPERRQEILQSVEGIAHVAESPSPQVQLIPTASRQLDPPGQLRIVDPPLGKALQNYFGGVEAATQYLDRVHDSYLNLIAEASALNGLGARYPQAALQSLPPDARKRIAQIAAQQIADLQHGVRDYIALVSPVLDEMPHGATLSIDTPKDASSSCGDWQQEAKALVGQLRHFQDPFSRLFVRHEVEEDVIPSAFDLLGDATNRRAEIVNTVQSLCLPE